MPLPPMGVPPPPPPLPTFADDAELPPLPSALSALQSGLPPAPETENYDESGQKSPRMRIIISLLLVLGICGAAGVSVWKKTKAKKLAQIALDAAKINTTVVSVKPVSAPPISSNSPPVEPRPEPVAVATTQPAAPATPVKFPLLRLQSIFYRPANPSVMINGKTLYVTDEIQGVVVADIHPASVTLVLSGQTNVLTLR